MALHCEFQILKKLSSGHKIVWRTKQVISKHATTLAKQADEHEQFITKVTYCLGVYCFGTICYLLGSRPQDVPNLYCIFFLSTVPLRWVYYRTRKWHYYLLDFCYYANAIFMVALLMYPRSEKLFMICFAISEGPLAWALIVWRCSLVFSSIDKIISVLIHLGPGTVFFILRWWAPMLSQEPQDASEWPAWPEVQSRSAMWTWLFLVPLLVYAVWQILYLLIVNVLRRQTILNDPELMTSYRELARKASRANNIWWRISGMLGDENRVVMYMVLQGLFTIATLALTVVLFMSYKLHMIFEILKLIASIWNGGDWLFEVMPKQAHAKKSKQTQALRKEVGLSCHLCSRQICATRIETST